MALGVIFSMVIGFLINLYSNKIEDNPYLYCESSSQSGRNLNRTDQGKDVGVAIINISLLFLLGK